VIQGAMTLALRSAVIASFAWYSSASSARSSPRRSVRRVHHAHRAECSYQLVRRRERRGDRGAPSAARSWAGLGWCLLRQVALREVPRHVAIQPYASGARTPPAWLLLLACARKSHGEDRLAIVGSGFRAPAMTLSDFADNVQAKTQAGIPCVGFATL
jgi:hypothetical protein